MRPSTLLRSAPVLLALLLAACGSSSDDEAPGDDTGTTEDSSVATDTKVADTARPDTASPDTATSDTATKDTATADTATSDTATGDTATTDTATADTLAADTATTDTATTDTATIDVLPDASCLAPGDAGATCNTLTNGSTDIAVTVSTSAMPTGTGGTIVDGLYYITELKTYAGSGIGGGDFGKQTAMLCGGFATFVYDKTGMATERSNFTYAPVGTNPNIVRTCSTITDPAIPYSSYTATPTTLTLYSSVYKFSVTYTKP